MRSRRTGVGAELRDDPAVQLEQMLRVGYSMLAAGGSQADATSRLSEKCIFVHMQLALTSADNSLFMTSFLHIYSQEGEKDVISPPAT